MKRIFYWPYRCFFRVIAYLSRRFTPAGYFLFVLLVVAAIFGADTTLAMVFQVFTFICLFIVSSLIARQVNFLKNKDLGFDKHNILSIPLGISNPDNGKIFQRLRDNVANNPQVENITASFKKSSNP